MRVITFGTYDIFHVGHLRLLNRAKSLGETLIVGLSSDKLNVRKKGRKPVYPYTERLEILQALSIVDLVFAEESLDDKAEYLRKYKADILVMGDDWQGKFDDFKDICEVIYLPRTPSISTSATIEKIRT